ncbi:MAG: PhzF family phenazine biosynthesis protein [Gammaproteobacteria bacterium]|nr:PhzF family phenazine biosynthesis protein [Gammaproteobacteria bacterium]
MKLEFFQVDAFTSEPLRGNPAAVVPLESWLSDDRMLAIAAENNLSETAFFVPHDSGGYHLRWFTPTREVDLCGHATLATAHVLFQELGRALTEVHFATASGNLTVRLKDGVLAMEFPSRPAKEWDDGGKVAAALHARPLRVMKTELNDPDSDKVVAVFESESDVADLMPSMSALQEVPGQGVVATAPGDKVDFVSRYFAPSAGVPEDPVTGSSHSTLTPYWFEVLGRSSMTARQISARGGDLYVEQQDNRVLIAGSAVLYLKGHIFI